MLIPAICPKNFLTGRALIKINAIETGPLALSTDLCFKHTTLKADGHLLRSKHFVLGLLPFFFFFGDNF